MTTLFDPLKLGALMLPNRIVMAPMTRMRADADGIPTAMNATYYSQRATAGLIVTEGTAVSESGQGFPRAPGIYTDAQMRGWQRVVAAVHAEGGRIVMQIAHHGRNSHSSLLGGAIPVAPSAVAPNLQVLTRDFAEVAAETPRAMRAQEIAQSIEDFRRAAVRAMDAGFDGVEVQAANGHLIDQFLQDGANRRDDRYGGSMENRMAFLFDIVERVGAVAGRNRIGVRLSPFGGYGGMRDSRPLQLFTAVIKRLSDARIGYLHLIEARAAEIGLREGIKQNGLNNARLFREYFGGPLVSAGGYTADAAASTVGAGDANAIAFGRLFTSNPDLVERIRRNQPFEPHDRGTFYGGDEHGYTDFITLS